MHWDSPLDWFQRESAAAEVHQGEKNHPTNIAISQTQHGLSKLVCIYVHARERVALQTDSILILMCFLHTSGVCLQGFVLLYVLRAKLCMWDRSSWEVNNVKSSRISENLGDWAKKKIGWEITINGLDEI